MEGRGAVMEKRVPPPQGGLTPLSPAGTPLFSVGAAPNIALSVREQLDTGWPWPLNAIQGWFESFWNQVSSWVWSGVTWVKDQVWGFVTWLRDRVWEGITWVRDRLWEVGGWIRDRLWEAGTWIKDRVWEFVVWLRDRLWEGVSWVKDRVWEFVNWIRDRMWEGVRWVRDELWGRVSSSLGDLWNRAAAEFAATRDKILGGLAAVGATILKPLQDFFSWILGQLAELGKRFVEFIRPAFEWIWQQVVNVASWIANAIRTVAEATRSVFIGVVQWLTGGLAEMVRPSTPIKEIDDAINDLIKELMLTSEEMAAKARMGSPVTYTFVADLTMRAGGILAASEGAEVLGMAADQAHPVKNIGLRRKVERIINKLGIPQLGIGVFMGWATYGALPMVRRWWMKQFRPEIPSPSELRTFYLRGLIDEAAARETLAEHGLSDKWIDATMASWWAVPDVSDLRTFYLRGYIDEATARKELAKHGLSDKWIKCEMDSWWVIPGISDLITFTVREVISPEDLVKWGKMQGLSEYWAKCYWESHWVLPSFGDLREAMWRGIISPEEFAKFVVWHDYKPEPRPGISKSDRDIMMQLSYRLPGRIDARWMLRWGIIGRSELQRLTLMEGMHPDWAGKVAEAEYLNMLLDERTALRTVYIRQFALGLIDEATLRAKLKACYFCDDEVNWLVQRAKVEYELKLLEEKVEAAREAFRKDVISESEFLNMLIQWGIREERARAIVDHESFRKLPRPRPARR